MNANQDILALNGTFFLSGPAGTGKTTLATRRLRALLDAGILGDTILISAPQRRSLAPYQAELRRSDVPSGARPLLLTLGGIARQMVELFWPTVAPLAGFARPGEPPTFLTLETAQFYMARVVGPLMAEAGYFEGIHTEPPRIYAQILDNLNKSALAGLPYTEIGERLQAAWSGESRRAVVFAQAEDAAIRFRQYCLEHNLLDFSLQVDSLMRHLLPVEWFRDYLFGQYRHVIADNVEEEPPAMHALLREWLPHCQSALLVYDTGGGVRTFLGADPQGGLALRDLCQGHIELTESHVMTPDMDALAGELARAIRPASAPAWAEAAFKAGDQPQAERRPGGDASNALAYGGGRFHTQMLDWVADEIARLTTVEHIPPEQIVVLTPLLNEALRFAVADRLSRRGMPSRSLRSARMLVDEPAARCLMTLAELAHLDWGIMPALPDVAQALAVALGVDMTRAFLLAQRVYPLPGSRGSLGTSGAPHLRPFDGLKSDLQDRIGLETGEHYEVLLKWLDEYASGEPQPIDHFVSRLFGEVLSQPGFGFHQNLDAGRVAAELIASAAKFRQVIAPEDEDAPAPASDPSVGRAYVEMIQSGVIEAQHNVAPSTSSVEDANAVLIAPAYTFLLAYQPVEVQFWLNANSPDWWNRLYQPLTHPYVLTPYWEPGRQWTDQDEQAARQLTLYRLTQGLVRRCRRKVYLAVSVLNEQGFEERGPLLPIAQHILRNLPPLQSDEPSAVAQENPSAAAQPAVSEANGNPVTE